MIVCWCVIIIYRYGCFYLQGANFCHWTSNTQLYIKSKRNDFSSTSKSSIPLAVLQWALILTIVLHVLPLKGSWVFQSQNVNSKRRDPISVDIKPQRFMKVTRLKTYYMILSPLILKLIGSWSFHLCYWKWLVHASLKLRLGPHWFTKIVSYHLPFSKHSCEWLS